MHTVVAMVATICAIRAPGQRTNLRISTQKAPEKDVR